YGAGTFATVSGSDNSGYGFVFDNPGTAGDDGKLMDDAHDGALTLTFAGLLNGDYDVYTYAWAPDSGTFLTNVSVVGSPNPMQAIGGSWPGGFAQGVTHAKHRVSVTNGTLLVDCSVS